MGGYIDGESDPESKAEESKGSEQNQSVSKLNENSSNYSMEEEI